MRWLRAFLRALTQRVEGGHVPTRRDHDDDIFAMLSPGGPVEPTYEEAVVHSGEPTAEWCPHCLLDTVQRTPLYALVSEGPYRIGEYAVCEECAYSPYATKETR